MEKEITEKFNKGVGELRAINMNPSEKNVMLQNILNSSLATQESKPSPYFFSFISRIESRKFVYIFTPCLIIFILSGTAFASKNSLPGNILYPLKVHVLEPTYLSLLSSPAKKAAYASTLADKRLTEAETLAKEDKLDEPKEEELSALLKVHTAVINSAINESGDGIQTKEENDSEAKIVSSFETNVDEHARILNSLKLKGALSVTSKLSVTMDEQALEDSKVSQTAKEEAAKLRVNWNKKINNEPQTNEAVDDQKDVQSDTPPQATANQETNISNKDSLDNVDATLEQTKKILDELNLDN